MNYLILDSETNGLPQSYHVPITDLSNWPRLISVAWGVYNEQGHQLSYHYLLVKPDGYPWNRVAQRIHGITQERAEREGKLLVEVLQLLQADIKRADAWVGHNIDLDFGVIGAELVRTGFMRAEQVAEFASTPLLCTMNASKKITINGAPVRLDELYRLLMNKPIKGMHDAQADMLATAECFFELKNQGYF
jgi:DNA polymerase III epsilon subunit-like protein